MIEELVIAATTRERVRRDFPGNEALVAKAVQRALDCYSGGASVSEACRAGWLWAWPRADVAALAAVP